LVLGVEGMIDTIPRGGTTAQRPLLLACGLAWQTPATAQFRSDQNPESTLGGMEPQFEATRSASKPGSTLSCRRIELNDLLFRCVR
jgi:hypothetical protein